VPDGRLNEDAQDTDGLRDANLSAMVAMVVMQPARGDHGGGPLPALDREFTRYRLA
jgi:hypothetical protein